MAQERRKRRTIPDSSITQTQGIPTQEYVELSENEGVVANVKGRRLEYSLNQRWRHISSNQETLPIRLGVGLRTQETTAFRIPGTTSKPYSRKEQVYVMSNTRFYRPVSNVERNLYELIVGSFQFWGTSATIDDASLALDSAIQPHRLTHLD